MLHGLMPAPQTNPGRLKMLLCHHLTFRLAMLVFYEAILSKAISSNELCASKVCSGCIAGSLSCQEGGLTALPDQLSSDIQSVIFIGHEFKNTFLTMGNFSSYQTNQLQRLTLRNCGIDNLQQGTFQSLKNLTQLDLSQNRLKVIEANTFMGLKLEFLRLDENHGLRLIPGAFYQASIVSLSINNCDLRSLTFEDLQPLFQNGMLTNLHLTGNKLITLESSLEPIFLTLQSLSIEQNPFKCDCHLLWLVNVLQQRSVRRPTRALDYFNSGTGTSFALRSTLTEHSRNQPFEGDTLKPVCRTPERLTGKLLEKLTPRDFYCELPQLQSLEIDLSQISQPSGLSSSLLNRAETSNGYEPSGSRVTLRCEIKGSPELQVSWYRRLNSQGYDLNNDNGNLQLASNSMMIKPGLAELNLNPSQTLPFGMAASAKTWPVALIDRLVCMATDLSGNTSADVRIFWPRLKQMLTVVKPKNEDSPTVNSVYPVAESSDQTELKFGNKKPSDNSPKTEVRQDWFFLTGEDPHGFWLQKQFSALQMIGAVVGTFTITLLLFVLGCCLLKAQRLQIRLNRTKVPMQENMYGRLSLNRKYTNPPNYNPGVQQASNVYQATNGNLAHTQQPLSQNSYQTNSVKHVDNGTIASEMSGTKRFPYATYEPVPTTESIPANSYSDSQTYDLPQFPLTLSPPKLPLPPVPPGLNPQFLANTNTVDSWSNFNIASNPTQLNDNLGGLHISVCSSPMLTGNSDHYPNTAALSATLSRMHPTQAIRAPLPLSPQELFTSQQYMAAVTGASQNQLFKFMNCQSSVLPQAQEISDS